MAVFDIALLGHFSIIFPFLLAWVIVFGVLSYTKSFGDNKGLHSIIALCLAFLFVLSKDAVQVINFASPWFVLFFIFIIFVIMAFKVFGATDADIMGVMKNPEFRYISTIIAILSIIIIIASFSNVMGQRTLEEGTDIDAIEASDGSTATSDFSSNVMNTIFHPQVLGLLVILIIASLTIKHLTQT